MPVQEKAALYLVIIGGDALLRKYGRRAILDAFAPPERVLRYPATFLLDGLAFPVVVFLFLDLLASVGMDFSLVEKRVFYELAAPGICMALMFAREVLRRIPPIALTLPAWMSSGRQRKAPCPWCERAYSFSPLRA